MDARELFLVEHTRVHALTRQDGGREFSLQEAALRGLSAEQLRSAPPGMNSVVWLLWHMARIEDVAANLLASDGEEVLTAGGWAARIGVPAVHVGTGASDEEVAGFSGAVEIDALLAYRAAVGEATRQLVTGFGAAEWDAPVPEARIERALAAGTAGPRARGLADFWRGRSVGWLLSWTALGHSYQHLGEALCTRAAVRPRR